MWFHVVFLQGSWPNILRLKKNINYIHRFMELLAYNLPCKFSAPRKFRKCGPKPHQPLYSWKACGNSRFKFIFSLGPDLLWARHGPKTSWVRAQYPSNSYIFWRLVQNVGSRLNLPFLGAHPRAKKLFFTWLFGPWRPEKGPGPSKI